MELEFRLPTVHPVHRLVSPRALQVQSRQIKKQYNPPGRLVIKEAIRALLELLGDLLGLLVPLEPRLVLLVEPPTLVLQRLRRQILLIRALLVVEYVKQSIRFYPRVKPGVVEYRQWLLRVPGDRWRRYFGAVRPPGLLIEVIHHVEVGLRGRKHPQV